MRVVLPCEPGMAMISMRIRSGSSEERCMWELWKVKTYGSCHSDDDDTDGLFLLGFRIVSRCRSGARCNGRVRCRFR